MRVLWLPEVLRGAGLTVVEHSGWQTRGFQPWEPRYGIAHATAAPRTQTDAAQVAIVRDGRKDLAGPIANACVDRTGRWHVLASGRCNTALTGWGGPASGLGNTHLLGVEACNDNGLHQPPEPWPAVQYEAYARGWAAICRRLGWTADKVVGHKEHQPKDKSDPLFSMSSFRTRISALIEGDDMSFSTWSQADRDLFTDEVGWGRENPTLGMNYAAIVRAARSAAIQARDLSRQIAAEQAAVAGQIAGLTALVQQLATAPAVQLTDEQLEGLTAVVAAAAREPGERIAAALAAAGEALAEVDDAAAPEEG